MRILFALRCFLYYTSELANGLARAGHDVIIAAADSAGEFVGAGSGDVRAEYRELLDPRVTLEWIPVPKNTSSRTIRANLGCIGHLMGVVRTYQPDVFHLHDISDYRIITAIGLTRRHRPLVLTVHDAEFHPGDRANMVAPMASWLRRTSDALIVHGEDVKGRLMAVSGIPEGRMHYIPHGAFTFYRRWASDDVAPAANRVLFFGRILEYKGLDYLIRAASTICREVPGTKIVIAGSGADWPRCKALIRDPDCFIVHEGTLFDPDVTRVFQEASVAVLPYIEASGSGVLAVAYALGKPVVVTNVGSLPEVVDEGATGLVVPARDEDALAQAVVKILKDDELRQQMGRRAYERADTDLSWDTIAHRTAEIYSQLASRRTQRS